MLDRCATWLGYNVCVSSVTHFFFINPVNVPFLLQGPMGHSCMPFFFSRRAFYVHNHDVFDDAPMKFPPSSYFLRHQLYTPPIPLR